jgi:death-on-curing protein
MTSVVRWVDKQALLLLHGESLAEHGGLAGLRDEGLFESALARPQNLAAYRMPTIHELAACYGVGIAKNHPFADGNKRAAFLATGMFLALNGFRLTASQVDATKMMLGVAPGEITEANFATWLQENSAARGSK